MKFLKVHLKPILFVIIVAGLILAVVKFDLTRYLNLSYMQSQLALWKFQLDEHHILFVASFFAIYVITTTLSIPGAALLTLLGGALFGLLEGTIIISFASTIGATISFLISRFFLRASVEKKLGQQYKKIHEGINREGGLYLFALRLIPIFPFFVINLAMGLTRIRVLTYVFVSQIGMLPGTIAYVNVGRSLSELERVKGLLSPQILLSFVILACIPFISKKFVSVLRTKKAYKNFTKPKHFDVNLVVIGAGAGGLVSSYLASTMKSKVVLIEKYKMGGDCLNHGCVPSKTLLSQSKYALLKQQFETLKTKTLPNQFREIMKKVHASIARIAPNDSVERYTELGVQCIAEEARILSPWVVQAGKAQIHTRSIIIATGSRPRIPNVEGLEGKEAFILTSENVWNLDSLPKTLAIIGGGPIGCELALAFAQLGSSVTLIHHHKRLLPKNDPEASKIAYESLKEQGVEILLEHTPVCINDSKINRSLKVRDSKDSTKDVAFEKLLLAAGRQANVETLSDKKVEIELDENGLIRTNQFLQTNYPNIFAVGDVASPYKFTHMSSHMAYYAVVNSLFGFLCKQRVDFSLVPSVTFLEPEIGSVGFTEEEVIREKVAHEITRYEMSELDRAITEQKTKGFIKVITEGSSDKILGVTVVGERGGEILGLFIFAMKHKLGLNKILSTIFPYPTYMEAAKNLAGKWRRGHKPEKVLKVLEKFFGLFVKRK